MNAPAREERITFNRDIAPIIFANCSACHRPGQSAPFSLLSYDDVKKRARQIAQVTQTRFMPPWLPMAGESVHLVGERRLSDADVELIERWMREGAPEGDEVDRPNPPLFSEGWPLGEPDWVLTLPEPYVLPAATQNTVRTFVYPVSLPGTRVMGAIDIQLNDPRLVHHASFSFDTTGAAKELDAHDPQPGYPGMADLGFTLAGSLGTWSPNAPVQMWPEGVGRIVPKQGHLLVEMHFNPSGKAETVQPKIGLYLAKGSITHRAVSVSLGSSFLDIAAGESEYVVRDSFTVPVDVKLHEITPHAHYVCRRIKASATLPDGPSVRLLTIEDWNFNFQQAFRLCDPLELPKGSTLEIELVYDNSAANLRNPHNPPQRVQSGATPADEMALVFFTMIAMQDHERRALERAHQEKLTQRMQDAQRQRAR